MKTRNQKQIVFGLLSILGVVLSIVAVGWLLSILAVPGIAFATGTVIADAAVTEQGARDAEADLMMEDVAKQVTEMLPDKYPMDTIIRNIRKAETCKSQIKRYYSISSRSWSDTSASDGATNGTDAGGSKSYTYSSGDGLTTFIWKPVNADTWNTDDTLVIRDVTVKSNGVVGVLNGSAETTADIVFYVQKKSSGALTLKPVNGILGSGSNAAVYVVPNITASMVFYRLGIAKNELAASTEAWQMIPEPDEQYLQYFMAQIEEGEFYRRNLKEVQWGIADFERHATYDLRGQMEASYLFGAKANVYNAESRDKRYTTGGITRLISNTTEWGASASDYTLTEDDYLDWMETVFAGTSGSTEKYMFAGSTLIKSLHKIEAIKKQLDGRNIQVKFGVKFSEIETNFGLLYIKHHSLFNQHGLAADGYIFDLEHVRKATFMPLGVRDLDLKSTGTKNAEARVLSECSGLYLTYPDVHLAIKHKRV